MKARGALKSYILLGLSFGLIMASLYMVFIYVPTEATMGIVQRILYLMVPSAWLAMLAFFIVFLASIMYLWKRSLKWDIIASSAAELGLVFTTLAIIVGSIWAKPIWGVWWTWEPRLTATLVLWLILIAYFLIRSYVTEEARGARFAAVVGIIGFVDIPIIGMATTLWKGIHPSPMIFEGGLDPAMLATLLVSIAAFTALFSLLLMTRVSIKNAESDIKRLKGMELNS